MIYKIIKINVEFKNNFNKYLCTKYLTIYVYIYQENEIININSIIIMEMGLKRLNHKLSHFVYVVRLNHHMSASE